MVTKGVPLIRDQSADDKQKDDNFVGCVYIFLTRLVLLVGYGLMRD